VQKKLKKNGDMGKWPERNGPGGILITKAQKKKKRRGLQKGKASARQKGSRGTPKSSRESGNS